MHIMNTEYFGIVMVPLESHNTLEQESQHFDFIRLEAIGKTFPSLFCFLAMSLKVILIRLIKSCKGYYVLVKTAIYNYLSRIQVKFWQNDNCSCTL